MPHEFCPGYPPPFDSLVASYPDATIYPPAHFRTEWGPIFHRGRLDGSARVLVIGQDPAAHETFARRILIGEAGQRVQGLLAKLGIDRSYVMVNAVAYSVYGSSAGAYVSAPAIVAYRNQWLDALIASGKIQVVIALGGDADQAWNDWNTNTATALKPKITYVQITHPTADAHAPMTTAKLLTNWNAGLDQIYKPTLKLTQDVQTALVPYGNAFAPSDLRQIPERDLPPGLPAWMRDLAPWAERPELPGADPKTAPALRFKRRRLLVTVPDNIIP
ncbi:MAG: uracil-DNA glycosylase family protein [Polyangiales bacterium]